ncbi:MAG: MFS transporter [Gammaproteobacteria bacterium]|nr:MFS transporter [Gammaproteobacteria bacterium]
MKTEAPPRSAYPWYLASSSLWMAGMSLQGFLFTWLLVGILERPASEAGLARSLAEFPPLIVLLLGGVLGDRINGRSYLMVMHLCMSLPPLLIAMVFKLGLLSYWWVVLFGVLMASIQSLSDPARQAVLTRVTRIDVQRAITIMTISTSLVGLLGFYIGGQLENLGLGVVLLIQSSLFFAGLFAAQRLPHLPVATPTKRPSFAVGLKAVWRLKLIRNIVGLNFLSSLFNAGAYIIVIPYIVKDVYLGDAALFATVMIVFTIGSIGSNVVLLAFMPLAHPGRLFLVLQLTRIIILIWVWMQPSLWLFLLALVAWGTNMGITTTLVRTTVQELAPQAERAQILSILLLSFMVSSPISAILLGFLIEGTSPLTGLIPGMAMSLLIFAIGSWKSGLWQYRSEPSILDRA